MASTLWPTNGTFTSRQLRQTIGAAWGALTGRPLGARSGIVAGTPSTIVSMSGSTYSVAAHKGVLDVETNAVAGPYNYSFDTPQTGTANAADSANDRIDLLSLTLSDSSEGDSSISGPTIVYTPGTPGSGVQPTTPTKNVQLARITVPKLNTGSPTITLIAPFTVAAGGVIPCRNSTEYPSSPYVGQYVDDASLGLLRWDGAKWAGGDSGWLACTINGTWPNTTVRARRIGTRVFLSIQSSDAYPGSLSAFFTLPAGIGGPASPAGKVLFDFPGNPGNAGSNVVLQVGSNGQAFVARAGVAPVAGIFSHGEPSWLTD